MVRPPIRIRDPIHGTLQLSRDEIHLVDGPSYQRLRMIKQLGLADLAFPGATHTRYAHGLGVMHIASRMFAQLSMTYDLPSPERERLLGTVRLAALFHDLGHAPLSHTTEAFMPRVAALALGRWQEGPGDRLANHEDYTLKMLVDSELTRRIQQRITPETGVTADDVATLVAGRGPSPELVKRFHVAGKDWMPMMRQCVSSELDADRMDYLLRDSYYAGVPYGRYDHEWLLENLVPVEREDGVHLGLDARASFSFEDFLLSRYHMFTSVYFHQIPIGYEVMLRRFHAESAHALEVPADVDGYLQFDDIALWTLLRQSKSPWARRIVERRAYRMLHEVKEFDAAPRPRSGGHADDGVKHPEQEIDLEGLKDALTEKGIGAMVHSAKGELSKYFKVREPGKPAHGHDPPLYVVDSGQSVPIEQYTPLYHRYAGAVHLRRLYVEPERYDDAKRISASFGR